MQTTSKGQVSIQTDFRQEYRVASPTPAGTQLAAATSSSGETEIFSIGSDHEIYRIYPDTKSDTGWSMAALKFPGKAYSLAAASNPDGSIAVWGATKSIDEIHTLRLDAKGTWRKIPPPPEAPRGANLPENAIKCGYDDNHNPMLCFCSRFKDSTEKTEWHIFDIWTELDKKESWLPGSGPLGDKFYDWCPAFFENLESHKRDRGVFVCVPRIHAISISADPSYKYQPMLNEVCSRVTAAPNADGLSQPFVILESDKGIYAIVVEGGIFTKQKIGRDIAVTSIAAGVHSGDLLEVFAIGTDGHLFHVHQEKPSHPKSAPSWGAFLPLNEDLQLRQIITNRNPDGHTDLFAITTAGDIYHGWFDPTGTWHIEEVEFGSSGKAEELSAYHVQMTIYNENKAPAPHANVTVASPDPVLVTINGQTLFLDKDNPWHGKSDDLGVVAISIDADTLGVPTLEVRTDFLPAGQSIHVDASTDVRARLATLKDDGSTLKEAHQVADDGTETPLIKSDVDLAQVSRAVKAAADLAVRVDSGESALFHANSDTQCARVRAASTLLGGKGPLPGVLDRTGWPDRHWQVDFSSGQPVFRELSESEYSKIIADQRGALQTVQEAGLHIDWGDVFNAAEEGFGKITKYLVRAVKDGVQATINLVIDGVEYLFEAAVKVVSQAMDLAEAVLSKVGALFENIFRWLGFIFNWGDIKLTAEAITHAINTTFDFVELGLDALGAAVRNGSSWAQGEIKDAVTSLLGKIGQQSIGEYADLKPNADAQKSLARNPLFRAFANNSSKASVTTSIIPAAQVDSGVLDTILAKLTELGDNFNFKEGNKAFDQAVDLFKQIGDDPSNVLTLGMAALVRLAEAMALEIIAVAEGVILSILDLTKDIIALVQQLLNDTWTIPVVSEFYAFFTGNKPTFKPIDLFALILAAPGTIFYKITFGAAPFIKTADPRKPNSMTLESFKSSFTADWLAQRAGIKTSAVSPALEAEATNESSNAMKQIFESFEGASLGVRFVLEQLQIVPNSAGVSSPWQLDAAIVFSRLASTIFAVPAFRSYKEPGLVWTTWGLQLLAGPLLRGSTFVLLKRAGKTVPRGLGDIILTLWGGIHFGMVAVRAYIDPGEARLDKVDILGTLAPQALRFMALPYFVVPPFPQPVWGGVLVVLSEVSYLTAWELLSNGDSADARRAPALTTGSEPVPA